MALWQYLLILQYLLLLYLQYLHYLFIAIIFTSKMLYGIFVSQNSGFDNGIRKAYAIC